MITKKFTIQFISLENDMSTEILISKKEYEEQIKFLSKQIKDTKNNEEEYKIIKLNDSLKEDNFIVLTTKYFTNCTATTILRKYECKEGYRFKGLYED